MSGRAQKRPAAHPDAGELDARVARAIAYIRERIAAHSRQLYLEVGEHLFEGLFASDIGLYEAKGAWGRTALTEIAESDGVEMSLDQLYAALHYHVTTKVYRRRARRDPPALSIWKWDRLWKLEADPASLVQVADWAAREGASLSFLVEVSRLVEPYLAQGGRLEDLLVGGIPGDVARDTPYRRMSRLIDVIAKWVEADVAHYTPRLRRDMLAMIDDLLSDLSG